MSNSAFECDYYYYYFIINASASEKSGCEGGPCLSWSGGVTGVNAPLHPVTVVTV